MKPRLGLPAIEVAALLLCLVVAPVRSSAQTWTDRGPEWGGRLDAIVASSQGSDVLLVATPGGGVWRTSNGGASWHQPQNYGLADFSVFHLEWDRLDENRLLAMTWSDVYASSDLGDTWNNLTKLSGIPAPLMPFEHHADPKPFAQLKLSRSERIILWGRPCSGLWYSLDGVSFSQHYPFPGGSSNPDNCLQAIAADDLTGKVYFSTMKEVIGEAAHVYASTCAWTASTPCLTWTLANTNLPTGVTVAAITWTGVANRMAAAMPPSRGSASTRVFVTTDGSTWSGTTALSSPSWDARPLVWPGNDQLFLGTVVGFQTTDLGNTWISLDVPAQHPDIRGISWRSYASNSYVWTVTDGTIAGSYANITRWNWTPGSAATGGTALGTGGLRIWQSYYAAVTPSYTPQGTPRIFTGTQDNGGACSDNRGVSWTTSGAPSGLGCADYISLVFAPSNPNRAYARTCSPGVARTNNAVSATSCSGVTWTELTSSGGPYPPVLWTRAMTAVHPTDPDRVYFARYWDIAVSADGGSTLTPSSPFPDGGANPVSVYVDASGNIYAGTIGRGAFVSTDNGASWSPWGLNSSSPRVIMNIVYSPAAGGSFFMATTSGLYRRLPGGVWTRLDASNAGYAVSDIEIDPNCPHRLYAGQGFIGPLGVHRGGITMSSDNGDTWTSITAGTTLHQGPIPDVQVDASDSRYLYAASYGQGVWEYDYGYTPLCPILPPSPTPTITVTPSATPPPEPSATPSRTPTKSPTATVTRTATPTSTRTPTIPIAPTATVPPTPADCVGDCNKDNRVSAGELTKIITIVILCSGNANGCQAVPGGDKQCLAADRNGNGFISAGELTYVIAGLVADPQTGCAPH